MELYKDYLPANARIVVDYKAKEKVKFTYPIEWTYWQAVKRRALPTILSFWLLVNITILRPFALVGLFFLCLFFIFIIINPIYSSLSTEIIEWNYSISIMFFGFIFYFIGLPTLFTHITALNKNYFSKMLPYIGYLSIILSASIKQKEFYTNDIINNKAIIPSFSNVYLSYKTTDDFNKYLEKIEIYEIPFEFKRKSFWYPFIRKYHIEKNDFEYSAVFVFSETPKEGKLEVTYN